METSGEIYLPPKVSAIERTVPRVKDTPGVRRDTVSNKSLSCVPPRTGVLDPQPSGGVPLLAHCVGEIQTNVFGAWQSSAFLFGSLVNQIILIFYFDGAPLGVALRALRLGWPPSAPTFTLRALYLGKRGSCPPRPGDFPGAYRAATRGGGWGDPAGSPLRVPMARDPLSPSRGACGHLFGHTAHSGHHRVLQRGCIARRTKWRRGGLSALAPRRTAQEGGHH